MIKHKYKFDQRLAGREKCSICNQYATFWLDQTETRHGQPFCGKHAAIRDSDDAAQKLRHEESRLCKWCLGDHGSRPCTGTIDERKQRLADLRKSGKISPGLARHSENTADAYKPPYKLSRQNVYVKTEEQKDSWRRWKASIESSASVGKKKPAAVDGKPYRSFREYFDENYVGIGDRSSFDVRLELTRLGHLCSDPRLMLGENG
jgi:hypothetical protein